MVPYTAPPSTDDDVSWLAMFGWLIRGEVNDDAVRLKTVAEMVAPKYCTHRFPEACAAVTADFPETHRHIDPFYCNFSFSQLEAFNFSIDRGTGESPLALNVLGRGKYHGFMLQTMDGGSEWWASLTSSDYFPATGGARTMKDTFVRKLNARDMDKLLSEFGRP